MHAPLSEAAKAGHNRPRNAGAPLDAAWFESVGVNASAVERRSASLTALSQSIAFIEATIGDQHQ